MKRKKALMRALANAEDEIEQLADQRDACQDRATRLKLQLDEALRLLANGVTGWSREDLLTASALTGVPIPDEDAK